MPTEITVTGCGDCPMYSVDFHPHTEEPQHRCGKTGEWLYFIDMLFDTCPLKTDSITIKLKSNETHKTDVRGGR